MHFYDIINIYIILGGTYEIIKNRNTTFNN